MFLQNTQESDLGFGWEFTDFIEKIVPP